MAATQLPDSNILALLLENGFPANAQELQGMQATALMYAAYTNNINMLELLVANKADINLRDVNGDPAVNWAVYAGCLCGPF
ncbi:MAG: ankyrin repeat domain-containing protein [Aestuariibacter sp.]